MEKKDKKQLSYWHWLFRGSGAGPGYRRIADRWLFVHLLVGVFISTIVRIDLTACANTVLLPLVGILIGLSFAWAGNAQALMQSTEIGLLSEHHEGGFVQYVYLYQTAILVIIVTLVFWGLAGLHIFDKSWPTPDCNICYFGTKVFLFTLSSLTLRLCWQVIMAAHWMLLAQKEIKEHLRNKKNDVEK